MQRAILFLLIVVSCQIQYESSRNEYRIKELRQRENEQLQILRQIELNTSNSYQTELKIDFLNARLNTCELTHTGW